ncbi:MAG TPA: hypothetical protein VFM23_09405, partial [Gemmatimonadales bacterium]|nr:hypothetical protein [Gemmatimonadales bacterium]
RPAEWAHVRAATRPAPLHLAAAPRPVEVHPPPLDAPDGAAAIALGDRPSAARDDSIAVSGWIARQGMRVLWSRFTPYALDSLLDFVDLAALNALATIIPVPALDDTIGTRNIWRVTAERMQATSVRWFPAVSLHALAAHRGEGADEVDAHGELAPVGCGLDSVFWRTTVRPALRQLTRLGGARSDVITGIALDLDSAMTYYRGSGFCEADFRLGLSRLELDSAELSRMVALPPAVRYDTLLERGWLGRYFSALEEGVAERAVGLRGELRRLHPDLRFAFHATEIPSDWFSLGLLRGFSTRDTPVLLWLAEPRAQELVRRYAKRGIYALSALRLEAGRATFGSAEAARLRVPVFSENSGFWLDGAGSDSLGRALRRFVR